MFDEINLYRTFKYFYKATTTLMVFCSVAVTARQFFGGPIVCDSGSVSHRFFQSLHGLRKSKRSI